MNSWIHNLKSMPNKQKYIPRLVQIFESSSILRRGPVSALKTHLVPKFYFLFLEILTLKQMVQVSLFSFKMKF